MKNFTLAICQHRIREDKEKNLTAAVSEISAAAKKGADIAVIPEMFVCDFVSDKMKNCAEPIDGHIVSTLQKAAADNHIWLVGGSFPEIEDGILYNTCPVISPEGRLVSTYRKTHLFDVDIKDGVTSTESDVFTPGDRLVVVDTGFVKLGIAICYDLRFPYVFSRLTEAGAELTVVPAAFSAKTGEAHWENALRSRAVDSQMFIAGAGGACGDYSEFKTYANSRIIDPWGNIMAAAGSNEDIIMAELSPEILEETRRALPLLKHSRERKLDGVFTCK